MFDCLILGDSIAVGVAAQRPECVAYAKGGWNSWQWNKAYIHKDLRSKITMISLGSNDHDGVHTFKELLKLRQSIDSNEVFWIMPAVKPHIQDHIRIIAKNFNDTILYIPQLSKDGVHPTSRGYRILAGQTK